MGHSSCAQITFRHRSDHTDEAVRKRSARRVTAEFNTRVDDDGETDEFGSWVRDQQPVLLASLRVAVGDLSIADAAAERALVEAAGDWNRRRGAAAGTVGLLRAGLGASGRAQRGRWRPAQRRVGTGTGTGTEAAWCEPALWLRIQSLSTLERRALALRLVAGLSPAEADEVTGRNRSLTTPDGESGHDLILLDTPLPLPADHEAIAALALQPNGPFFGPDHLRTQARRGRYRRRLSIAAAAVGAIVALLAVSSLVDTTDAEVDRAAPTTAQPRTAADLSVPRGAPGSLILEPSTGLRERQVVTATLPGVEPADVDLMFCVADPGTSVNRIRRMCERQSPGSGTVFRVRRYLQATNGSRADCAVANRHCVVLAAVWARGGGRGPDLGLASEIRVAPVKFENPNSIDRPRLVMTGPRPLTDGTRVQVQGVGFSPTDQVSLAVCNKSASRLSNCFGARAASVTADDAGRFRIPFILYHDIRAGNSWGPCSEATVASGQECVLRAFGNVSGVVDLRIDLRAPDGPGIRPDIEITAPGPYSLGQQVRIRGTGFQASETLQIGNCPTLPSDPSSCQTELRTPVFTDVTTGADGSFEIGSFTLPEDSACTAKPGACLVGEISGPFEDLLPLTFGP